MSKYEIDEETGEVLLNHSAISAEDVVDRLNDLEAKLAESERKYELSSCPTGGLVDRVRNLEQQLTQCEADRKFEQEKKDMAMKRVSELKQQLAEKDEEIKRRIDVYEKQFIEQTNENYELKQQLEEKEEELHSAKVGEEFALKCCNEAKELLAEKDKEIEALKYLCGCPNDINEMVRKVVYRDEQLCKQYDFFQDELKRKDQDKISFALEQLNQTKEEIGNNISPIIFQDSYWLGKQTVLDKIDNQIKQLKEGK